MSPDVHPALAAIEEEITEQRNKLLFALIPVAMAWVGWRRARNMRAQAVAQLSETVPAEGRYPDGVYASDDEPGPDGSLD